MVEVQWSFSGNACYGGLVEGTSLSFPYANSFFVVAVVKLSSLSCSGLKLGPISVCSLSTLLNIFYSAKNLSKADRLYVIVQE